MTPPTPDLSGDDFPAFYAELYDDPRRVPHTWQMRLFEQARSGRWPDAVTAPTGTGKSIIPIVHVFLCALDPEHRSRMCFVTPRRIITDQIHDEAVRLLGRLNDPAAELGPVMSTVRSRLLTRQPENIGGGHDGHDAVLIGSVRGGRFSAPDRRWMDSPTACTVMTMTRDMAMSRLLFNGYRTSWKNRSVEAGLLAHDTIMVFDEAHLTRQAASVARDVAAMVSGSGFSGLHVVEVTATPDAKMGRLECVIGVDAGDVTADSVLGRIMAAYKPLTVVHRKTPDVTYDGLGKYTEDIITAAAEKSGKRMDSTKRPTLADVIAEGKANEAAIAEALHFEVGRGSGSVVTGAVGVVCNTVAQAVAVDGELRKRGLRSICLTGRMRPHDRKQLIASHPGVLTPAGNSDVDVVVATQTIEVGVDCDFVAMVTQMCPGDSLSQRVGRVNRRGLYANSPVIVVDQDKVRGPYRTEDIEAAREWLGLLDDMSPDTLMSTVIPHRDIERPVVEHLSLGTAAKWFRVSGTKAPSYDDLALWILDDIRPEAPDVTIALRRIPENGPLVDDPEQRHGLLKALPIRATESWAVRADEADKLLRRLVCGTAKGTDVKTSGGKNGTIEYAVQAIAAITVKTPEGYGDYRPDKRVVPGGSTVVLWCTDGKDGIPMLVSGVPSHTGTEIAHPAADEFLDDACVDDEDRVRVLLGGEVPEPTDDDHDAAARSGWGKHPEAATWFAARRAAGCPDDRRYYVTLAASENPDERPAWAVVNRWHETSTESTNRVLLHNHRLDVAESARGIATSARLPHRFVEILRLAGLYHDDGKVMPWFQRWLQGKSGIDADAPLAKSGDGYVTGSVHTRPRYGMPIGWRHEQLSAALAHAALCDHPDRDLITLLAGFTHGRGRLGFPHGFATLVGDETLPADDIFSDGTWEDMVFAAMNDLGPWTLSYLDALLRAADHQVSAQGH